MCFLLSAECVQSTVILFLRIKNIRVLLYIKTLVVSQHVIIYIVRLDSNGVIN